MTNALITRRYASGKTVGVIIDTVIIDGKPRQFMGTDDKSPELRFEFRRYKHRSPFNRIGAAGIKRVTEMVAKREAKRGVLPQEVVTAKETAWWATQK